MTTITTDHELVGVQNIVSLKADKHRYYLAPLQVVLRFYAK